MLVNLNTTKALIIPMSGTLAIGFPNLLLYSNVVYRMTELMVFGVVLNTKQQFECLFKCMAASASSKLRIMR